jgi:peptidoglycan DL-endopeptidase CwlO
MRRAVIPFAASAAVVAGLLLAMIPSGAAARPAMLADVATRPVPAAPAYVPPLSPARLSYAPYRAAQAYRAAQELRLREHAFHVAHLAHVARMAPVTVAPATVTGSPSGRRSAAAGTPSPTSAPASHSPSGSGIGARILAEAQTRAGDWYQYGAAGPSTFDCSGLVYWASQQLGVNMPRDTYEMLGTGVAEGLLVPTTSPEPGDLAFFGSGHVEFVYYGTDMTFGAQQSGTQVGPHQWSGWWQPTAFYRIT